MRKTLLLFFLGASFFVANAQQSKDVLFTIDDSPVYISEFKRVYLKNIDLVKDDSQKNIDEYLDLFINYKLKLKEARNLGLDKKDTYLKEFEGYRKQLAKGYLKDTRISDALVKEAYDRSLERIQASHILIGVKPNASAKDTLAAYQKIVEARDKIIKGASFETIAKEYSQDPSVVKNGGDLGWFSAFRMVYEFEDAAYTTQVNDISMPFRTQFGFHIVKVNAREKKLGEVTVAHIMVAINARRTAEEAEKRIKEINQQLNQGVAFASLAKEYSDDPSTAIEGGKIRRFGQGALNSKEFEQTAFSLQEKGELSKPIKTKYGWHIIQLIEKHPLKTFKEQKSELAKKVEKDGRSKLVTKAFIDSLKQKYSVIKNESAISYFKQTIPETFFDQEWVIDENTDLTKDLFSIKDEKYSYNDFVVYLKKNKSRGSAFADTDIFVDQLYKTFESSKLLEYYENHLEEDNADFANIINEYREGLLLFDLMESKIWNVSKTDSIGLKKYYEAQKDKYTKNESYKVIKASSSKLEAINKVEGLLTAKKSIEEIKNEVNKGDVSLVLISEEELVKGKDVLPKDFTVEEGEITITNKENFSTLIMVKEIVPSRIKTFEETKGEVISDFQESIENKWLDSLKTKYSVQVNDKTLKRVRKELSI
ncbi:peptidylprolyl isomerase [Aquimarina pacifica]|uniref:peptidylprolyl isomerase n=1 Tax=Aquimarina pacifica TaxID=1296415 RepID=UPI000472023D|nr:peptidylprolyl isomerase [Aquimarina pacifica]